MGESLQYKHEAQASEFAGNFRIHSLALRACIRVSKPLTALPEAGDAIKAQAKSM